MARSKGTELTTDPPSPAFEQVITPDQSWWSVPVGEVYDYRDLLRLLVWRDFVTRYKQTMLGPLWFVIQPLVTSVVFTVIFGRVAKISTDDAPPLLFYMCGMLTWQYFSTTLNMVSGSLVNNADLFRKVYFPRVVVPLSMVASNLLATALQLATFGCFWVYFKYFTASGDSFHAGGEALLFPLLILQTIAIALGGGLCIASVTARYRDALHALSLATQLWLYATPVVYPMSLVPEGYRWLYLLNPMAAVVETSREMFIGTSSLTTLQVIVSICTSVLLLVLGLLLFQRAQRTFVDTV